MSDDDLPLVQIDVRIPAAWEDPEELADRMPPGYQLTPEALLTPTGRQYQLGFLDADDQFAKVFATACRKIPSLSERRTIENYTVNATLSGPGGSLQLAAEFMQSATALLTAGGAGVFIDNSAISHGGEAWVIMSQASPPEDPHPEPLSFAFTTIVGGRSRGYTHGLHILGQPNVSMPPDAIGKNGEHIIELVQWIAAGQQPTRPGRWTTPSGRGYEVRWQPDEDFGPGSPLHNPYGQLHLSPVGQVPT